MSESTWQVITPENQPKAPCFLGRLIGGETYYLPCESEDYMQKFLPDHTHWMPSAVPDIQPTKHPAEVAFEEYYQGAIMARYKPHCERDFTAGYTRGRKEALQYAAKELTHKSHCFNDSIFCSEMRDRLNKAAESL